LAIQYVNPVLEVFPEPLRGVQRWARGRQWDEHNVVGDLPPLGSMGLGPIEPHEVEAGHLLVGEPTEEYGTTHCVELRPLPPAGLAGHGLDCGIAPGIFVEGSDGLDWLHAVSREPAADRPWQA
jgi:hypothetical protein